MRHTPRALAGHYLRDDHGKTLFTSPHEDHRRAQRDAHAAAHEAEQREPLCTCNAFHRPHPHHGSGSSIGRRRTSRGRQDHRERRP